MKVWHHNGQSTVDKMAEGRKSTTERTYLDPSDEKAEKKRQEKTSEEDPNVYKESEKSVLCPSSDGVKSKQPPNTKTSPTSRVPTYKGMKCLDKNDRKVEKTMQQKMSKEDSNRYEESKEPVVCTSSDEFKDERRIHSVSSPTTPGLTSNREMTYLDMGDRKVEKTKQENSSEKEPEGHEESEKPMPCRSSDGFYAERLPASESSPTSWATPNIEIMYLHKADEKVEQYLELVDDVMIKKDNLSEKGHHEGGDEEPIPCTSLDKFNTKMPLAKEGTSVSAATKNISIEMTYLHKKDEEKVDKYWYMTLDEDSKRREDIGRYEALCTSTDGVNERPAAQERHSDLEATSAADKKYDDVLIESENSSVPDASGYEEPDVVNSERPPVPGRSHSRRVTSTPGETSVYQELQ